MKSIVAVITRTRDRPLLLRRAVQSVLNQSYPHWVHVIVNDGGDPRDVEAVVGPHREAYKGRLIVVSHPESLGMEAASNTGIRASSSRYVIIHDDDDSLDRDFLKEAVCYLGAPPLPQIQGVITLANRVDEEVEHDSILEKKRSLYKHIEHCVRIDDTARANSFPPISFLFRRSVLDEVGWFDEDLPVLGDWDFNLRFLTKYDIGVIPKVLANYHHRPKIERGGMGNTIYAQRDVHGFVEAFIRNRYLRTSLANNMGVLMLNDSRQEIAERLYGHPVIGRVIRLWSRWINPNIPFKLP